eukprot:TRINITY_DN5614_c0_g2_i2.p1 TRINITY_DN5614_c0_g2~~TRINITY_DN5614_c0_g2_i2.p1  ORF type:complete len:205 (+),score=29.97 TRINITY_DN5614_c0_g2_i2:617-1231(+)
MKRTIEIGGYNTFQQPRTVRRQKGKAAEGGGVAILVRKGIPTRQGETYSGKVTEKISVHVSQTAGPEIHIVNIYRPPIGGGDDTRKEDFVVGDLQEGENVLTMGDIINLHHEAWSAFATQSEGGRKVMTWVAETERIIWNDPRKPTWQRNIQRSSPDIVIGQPRWPRKWKLLEGWVSDHRPVMTEVPYEKTTEQKAARKVLQWQ